MSNHLTAAELEWYVTTGLDCATRGWPSDRIERIERHASECTDCRRALEQEARVELAMQELAHEPPPGRAHLGTWLASVALVAGLLLFLTVSRASGHDTPPSNTPGAVVPADAGVTSPAEQELALDARLR